MKEDQSTSAYEKRPSSLLGPWSMPKGTVTATTPAPVVRIRAACRGPKNGVGWALT